LAGTVPAASRSSPQLRGRPWQRFVLLLWPRARRGLQISNGVARATTNILS
jgi:hypothetical protein